MNRATDDDMYCGLLLIVFNGYMYATTMYIDIVIENRRSGVFSTTDSF